MGERRVLRGVRSGGLEPKEVSEEFGVGWNWGKRGELGKERTVGGGWEGFWGRR